MSGAWGSGSWGIGSYGGSGSASIAVAFAISTHEIFVALGGPPLARTPALDGDALNPATWRVVWLDTNRDLQVAKIDRVNAVEFVVRVLQALPGPTTRIEISADGIQNAGGGLADLPRSAVFAGLVEAAVASPAQEAATKLRQRDLANRPAPSVDGQLGGTFRVVGGDYVNDHGEELARKLIVRRVVAIPGDFFHLPAYGVGQRLKEPIPAGDLIKRRTAAENQIAQEPDVESVRVTITQAQNQLTTRIAAKLRPSGAIVAAGVTVPIGG